MTQYKEEAMDDDIRRLYDRGVATLVKAAEMARRRSLAQTRAFNARFNTDRQFITMQAVRFGPGEPIVMRRIRPKKRDLPKTE